MGERSAGANLALGLSIAVFALVATLWVGAQLAARLFGAGEWLPVGLGSATEAAFRLREHAGAPAGAWPEETRGLLPGPVPYWACTTTVALGVTVLAVPVLRVCSRPGAGSQRRRRLGVDTRARLARASELAPLIVHGPTRGRLVLGRVGHHLVATEDTSTTVASGSGNSNGDGKRRGDRSAVLVVGPTRCGKTSNCVSGILEWDGPAILSSVKSDLMGATIGWRRHLGDVRVFDPTGATGQRSAGWSPLRAATTITGAQKAARALCDAGPDHGAENLDFFTRLAEQLLWPLLWTAAVSGSTMRDVLRWVLTQDRPGIEGAGAGEVFDRLQAQLRHHAAERRKAANHALEAIAASWSMDERTRSSTYATVQTLVAPWADPGVAASTESCDINLDWLISRPNTLYLCAPAHEQARLAPVFGGLIGDLVQQAFERAGRTNRPLPPTLLVMDEAANTPTRWLPAVASTCSGIGILLVTIWQSKAQIDAAYGRLGESVITNHGTKIIFSGVSDPATLDYASRLVGDEDVLRRSESIDLAGGRRSVSDSAHPTRLLPVHVLRQVAPGGALLVHGTLPPAHLHARPYYRDRALAAKADGRIEAAVVGARQP
ncbi:MAG: type IV secretory system conjugative DNA transfer family protein [Acidimicrobiia bacterium]